MVIFEKIRKKYQIWTITTKKYLLQHLIVD
jgi:hypothetical protein